LCEYAAAKFFCDDELKALENGLPSWALPRFFDGFADSDRDPSENLADSTHFYGSSLEILSRWWI